MPHKSADWIVQGPMPDMDCKCSTVATVSAAKAAAPDSDANSVATATRASARLVVTPDSRTNATLLAANCSGSGCGQNSRPSNC
jgi:hypothetical protein